jgi:amino acid transporter
VGVSILTLIYKFFARDAGAEVVMALAGVGAFIFAFGFSGMFEVNFSIHMLGQLANAAFICLGFVFLRSRRRRKVRPLWSMSGPTDPKQYCLFLVILPAMALIVAWLSVHPLTGCGERCQRQHRQFGQNWPTNNLFKSAIFGGLVFTGAATFVSVVAQRISAREKVPSARSTRKKKSV